MFQSTRPRGARRIEYSPTVDLIEVSIHAPARGATPAEPTPAPPIRRFNPRARAGRDMIMPMPTASKTRFNPRARAGRDRASQRNSRSAAVFQSTRPRGARQSPLSSLGA